MIREIQAWWERMERQLQRIQPPQARKIVVAVVGFTVLLLGIAMLVLPGPALLIIPAGLAILGLEFGWARLWLHKIKAMATHAANRVSPNGKARAQREAARRRSEAYESFK